MGYYQDLDEDMWADHEAEREERRFLAENVSSKNYDAAKAAKVKTKVICAGCGNSFMKKSYQQAFCSSKGRGNCKDRYWNIINPRGIGEY